MCSNENCGLNGGSIDNKSHSNDLNRLKSCTLIKQSALSKTGAQSIVNASQQLQSKLSTQKIKLQKIKGKKLSFNSIVHQS